MPHLLKEKICLLFVVLIMPSVVFFAGYSYICDTRNQLAQSLLLAQLEPLSGRLPLHLDQNRFWAGKFNNAFDSSKNFIEFRSRLDRLAQEFGEKIEYAAWLSDGTIKLSRGLQKYRKKDWQRAGPILIQAISNPGGPIHGSDDRFMRHLVGPHFHIREIYNSGRSSKPRLIETDHTGLYPLVWANFVADFAVMVFLPAEIKAKDHGIAGMVNDLRNEIIPGDEFALVLPQKTYGNSTLSRSEIESLRQRIRVEQNSLVKAGDRLYFGEEARDGTFFVFVRRLTEAQPYRATILFTLFLGLLIMAFRRNLNDRLNSLKVAHSIYLLIFLSNLLPIFLMLFFLNQYLVQKKITLIDQKRVESIKFIQLMEQEYSNEISRFPLQIKQTLDEFKQKFNSGFLNDEDSLALTRKLKESRLNFKLVASSTETFYSNNGYMVNGRYQCTKEMNKTSQPESMIEVFCKLARIFLGFWNNTPMSQKKLTEAELVTDLLFQRPVDEASHLLVEINDRIGLFGYGTNTSPSIVSVLSLYQPEFGDYFGIFEFNQEDRAEIFLQAMQKERLGNQYGLKVIYTRGRHIKPERIAPFTDEKSIAEIIAGFNSYAPLAADIVELEGGKWVCSGYTSPVLKAHEIIALYPLEAIDKQIQNEQFNLAILLGLSLLFVFALAFIFSDILLRPVDMLEAGTKAIAAQNFSYRLPPLGDDELGAMANIFNEAIIDLEELNSARVVQQQLFPGEKLQLGNLLLFGRSITLAELGGDYYDFFRVDEDCCVALLGDVAGHGVGAAMIMALAKAATINSTDYFKIPVEFLTRLHQIIYESKTKKQKKIMTMQYLYVDLRQQSVVFANAGGCNPFIVNGRTGRLEEIVLPGAALGAFKKAAFKQMNIDFEPGDMLVLYTDGMIESRNNAGEEIGYAGFKKMLQKNYATEPQTFYDGLYRDYLEWLGPEPPQDDLTIMILGFRH